MRKQEKLSVWLGFGVPAFAVLAVVFALGVHVRFGIVWSELWVACVAVTLIQAVTLGSMFWARKRFRPINDPRPSILIAGVYSTVVVLTGMYYASRWGIVSWGSIREDFIGFPITVLSVTTVVIIFFSIRRPDGQEKK